MEQLGDALAAAWSSPLARLAALVAVYWGMRLGLPPLLPRQIVYVRLGRDRASVRIVGRGAGSAP